MKKGFILLSIFISVIAYGKSLDKTLRDIEIEKNAKCYKVKERTLYCLTANCYKHYDYYCITNSGELDLRLRVNVYRNLDDEIEEEVTKIIYQN